MYVVRGGSSYKWDQKMAENACCSAVMYEYIMSWYREMTRLVVIMNRIRRLYHMLAILSSVSHELVAENDI
jgi:hypothetical protein